MPDHVCALAFHQKPEKHSIGYNTKVPAQQTEVCHTGSIIHL